MRWRRRKKKPSPAEGGGSLEVNSESGAPDDPAAGDDRLILWHATSDAIVPPSGEDFELLSPLQRGEAGNWPDEVAPRRFLYLGDAASIAFLGKVLQRHGGRPVLLDVQVDESLLEPDPAYVETCQRLVQLGLPELQTGAGASLFWSGRVATTGPVTLVRRRVCVIAVSAWHACLSRHICCNTLSSGMTTRSGETRLSLIG